MDLTRVRPVFEATGPFLTLHLEVGRTTENGLEQQEARWTRVRHDLEHHGADAALIEQIGERMRENTHQPGEVRRTIVANAEGIILDDVQAGHSHYPEVVEHADLPDLTAWLAHEDLGLPFLLVVADRTGADLDVHWALSGPSVEQQTVNPESSFFITKVHAGGWSDRRFDQNVQNTWRANAEEVAREVHSVARAHRPRAVLLAGEVRARAELTSALEDEGVTQLSRLLQVESGGRGEGTSDEAMWEEVRGHLRTLAAEAETDLVARLDQARGRDEGAATGLDEVLEALAKAQVDTLLLDLASLEDKVVVPEKHLGLPLPEPASAAEELPAGRVLVAAAALTGAGLALAPQSLIRGGGAAALLRWAETPPTSPPDSI